jgi:hypothetical protein
VLRLFPGLEPLLAKKDDLLKLPELVSGFQSEQTAAQEATATRMWEALDAEVLKALRAGSCTRLRKSIDSAFVAWLEADKNAAARYRLGD